MRVGEKPQKRCVCSLAMCCRAASIPEAQDISRSSSNASSFASVVEENEGEEDYDTGQVGGKKMSFDQQAEVLQDGLYSFVDGFFLEKS